MTETTTDCQERRCLEKAFRPFEKMNYFCGRFMVDRDFRDEQRYHVDKRRLHTAALHGWGAACGLRVLPHPYCPNLRLVVTPGLAIDAWGREIFIPERVEVELESYRIKDDAASPATPQPETLFVVLRYQECETEPLPVFLDDCGCHEVSAPGRVREGFTVKILTKDDFEKDELEGYLFDQVEGAEAIDLDVDSKLSDLPWTGKIAIRTPSGVFKADDAAYAGQKVKDLFTAINAGPAKVKIEYLAEKSRVRIRSQREGDVILLEESGKAPLFNALYIPAFNTAHGYKMIAACPDRESSVEIILAAVNKYDLVKGDFLDSSKPKYKTPAYTLDNLSYRRILPGVDIIGRVAGFLASKL